MSRPDPSGAVQADAEHPTRNRKVVGSNPTSDSKTAGQRLFLAWLTAQPQQADIPWVEGRAAGGATPLRYLQTFARSSDTSTTLMNRSDLGLGVAHVVRWRMR